MFYVLKSSDVLDVLVPILYFLNDARADQCKWDVIPGVFPSSYMYIYVKQVLKHRRVYLEEGCLNLKGIKPERGCGRGQSASKLFKTR